MAWHCRQLLRAGGELLDYPGIGQGGAAGYRFRPAIEQARPTMHTYEQHQWPSLSAWPGLAVEAGALD